MEGEGDARAGWVAGMDDGATEMRVEPERVSEVAKGDEAGSPWSMPGWQARFLALFALTAGIVLFLRLYKLDSLQTEIYGDIDLELRFIRLILAGVWPVRFELSSGPLYSYLITPVIYFTGLNYAGLKLASVLVSLAGLAATYAFSRRLMDDYFALLVVFIAGISSWLLIFSRLGNTQIVEPLLTMLALWLVMRVVQEGGRRNVAACALVAGCGLLVLPQSFILPGVIFLTLWCLGRVGQPLPRGWAKTYWIVTGVCLLPFAALVAVDPYNFFNGYIGAKILPDGGKNALVVLAGNSMRAILALHVRGDANFRSNPYAFPHLDWVSGLLLLAGAAFWLARPERRRWTPVWLVPFVLLQLPSVLVINQPAEVPSASRTLGVAPLAYLLVASGLWWPMQALQARGGRRPAAILAAVLLTSMLILNTRNYFKNYMDDLPYHDTPIGPTIAAYANLLPPTTQVFMVGCCWQAIDNPDRFVGYDMLRPYALHYIEPTDLSCAKLQNWVWPAVFVWAPDKELPAPGLEACAGLLPAQLFMSDGRPLFNAAALRVHTNAPTGPPMH